jgi:hypothetical protein
VTVLAVAALVGGGVAAAQLGSGDDPDEDVSTGDDGDETTTEPDGETTSTDTTATSTSTSSSTTTTADPGGGGGTETTDPGGGGPGPDRGTTVPPQQTTTTTQPVAPGAPASALLFSPAVASPAPDNPVIEVQLQWSAPTSQGTGVDGYRLIGRMIVSGTNHVETITRDFGASERTASITYTSRGLANNGYIEWTLVARNEAGSSAPRLVSARVPNVVGTSTDDVYHRLWALGVIVDTNPNATCDVDEVCSQETSPNSTVPNRSRLVIHT